MTDPPAHTLAGPAREACRRSALLCPDSPRGAALLTTKGHIFAAPETADPGATGTGTCAERAAVYRAVQAGERRFLAMLTLGGRDGRGDAGAPCGACLQVLSEFSPTARVWWGTARRPRGGLQVRQLLPGAFRETHLKAHVARGRSK